jgi:hypothetical protein
MDMQETLPPQAKKYFWGDDLSQLNWQNHQSYITQTLLDKGDVDSITWLFQQSSKKEVEKIMPTLKLSKKSRNFWKTYLE